MPTDRHGGGDGPTGERILFVSADPLARQAFAAVCGMCGYDADAAEPGEDLRRALDERQYAVIAIDGSGARDGSDDVPDICRRQEGAALVLIGDEAVAPPPTDEAAPVVAALVDKPRAPDTLAEALERGLRLHRERAEARRTSGAFGDTRAVLLVDHDDDAAFIAEGMLAAVKGSPFRACRARSLAEALDAVRGDTYEAVLLDLSLPDAQGLDAIAGLRAHAPSVPIVVLTGLDDEAAGLEALDAGAQDYLIKGAVTGRELVKAVSHAVERKRSEERLVFLAYHDQVTGLANRTLLKERLGPALLRARRAGAKVGVLYLGLDRFKAFNEALGRDAGDAVLVEVARRIEGSLRSHEAVARIGGDEFVVVVEDLLDADGAARVAERVLHTMAQAIRVGERQLVVTTSIGIALADGERTSVSDLLKQAEAAMRRSKESGPNRFRFYTEEAQIRTVTRLDLEGELRGALERDEFVLHYQPLVDLRTGVVTGVEALLRWAQPGVGLTAPYKFIPLLEETRLIVPVGAWAVGEACRAARRLNDGRPQGLRVAVNVSGHQFEDEAFVDVVRAALTDAPLPASELELEITESVLTQDTDRTRQTLRDLKALGVRLAVDDFGTGYSSLAYLRRFAVDVLKVDRSFVKDILDDGDIADICRAVIGLGKALDLDVVAEGVEDCAQLTPLRSWRCDAVQGYYFAKPMREADLLGWLDARDHRIAA